MYNNYIKKRNEAEEIIEKWFASPKNYSNIPDFN